MTDVEVMFSYGDSNIKLTQQLQKDIHSMVEQRTGLLGALKKFLNIHFKGLIINYRSTSST